MEQSQSRQTEFMHRLAAGIVRGRFVLMLLFLAAGIYCALSLGRVLAPCALRLPADGYGRLMGHTMLLAASCAGP